MKPQGRPRALADSEKRRTVCALISAGAGIEMAARHVGCSTWTIRREAQRDEQFAQQLRDAQTAAEMMPLRTLRQAAGTEWRAAAWLLERLFPDRFARRKPNTVSPAEFDRMSEELANVLFEECVDEGQRTRIIDRLQQLQLARHDM